MEAAIERSTLVRDALSMARQAHAGQVRDTGSGTMPFTDHVLAVAGKLAEHGYPDEVVAAGLLHDAVESGDIEPAEVRRRFGDTVACIVDALTERPEIEVYEKRKEDLRKRVARTGSEAQAVFAADKLANVEVLREAYALEGEEVDTGLEVSLDNKVHVWEMDLKMLFDESADVPLVDRLANALAGLQKERATAARAASG
jgi:(p)ppGpp synthase/HD superfamily hydrolase